MSYDKKNDNYCVIILMGDFNAFVSSRVEESELSILGNTISGTYNVKGAKSE